ncbi:hypothetical protein A2335_01495 [Candidatus Peregrinibacteria bacterium RIFOXYB2_FULL_32_7]|nr:MAG: hypothetical protein A2335_01495 [Candidatus Peregrinibacteria bacterium RIFOXYB2_FULL_32_7]
MPTLAKIQTAKIDLIQMIRSSRSLKAKFNEKEMEEYIEKVKAMSLEEQKKLYGTLVQEQKDFEKLRNKGKEIVSNFNKSTQEIVNKVITESRAKQKALDENEAENILKKLENV